MQFLKTVLAIRGFWLVDKNLRSSHGICALVLLLEFVFLPILITWPNILSQASADRISWHPLVDIEPPEPTIYPSYCTFREILTQKIFLFLIFLLAESIFQLKVQIQYWYCDELDLFLIRIAKVRANQLFGPCIPGLPFVPTVFEFWKVFIELRVEGFRIRI